MAEGEYAGEAQEEIERHRRQPEHQNAGSERGVAADERHPIRSNQQNQPDGGERERPIVDAPRRGQAHGAHVIIPSSPKSPRGRTSSTTAIITYITASLAAGKNTVVTPVAIPMRRPPNTVPPRLPTPPTMMAMKLGIR